MPWRRRWRLAQRGLGYLVAGMLVAVALAVGTVSRLLPWVERNPERVRDWLSERAGREVDFDGLRGEWTRRGPLLQMRGLRVAGEGGQAIALGDAEMLVSQYAGLFRGHAFTELRLRGLDLTLERDRSGRWHVRGLPGQQQGGDPLAALEGLGELQIVAARLGVSAPELGIDAHLPRVDMRLQVDGDRLRAGLRARIRDQAAPLTAALDFDRRRGNGQAWAQVREAEIGQWSGLLRFAGVTVTSGHGDAQAWLRLRDHRVESVVAEADLQRLLLQGRALPAQSGAAAGNAALRARFDRLTGQATWRKIDGGWRLDAPTLRIEQAERTQTLDGLLIAGGQRRALLADAVDAGPLLAVAALSDRLTPAVRRWLLQARPHARLRELRAQGERGGGLRITGRIHSAGFSPVGDAPGLEGVSGELLGDAHGAWFGFDPGAQVIVNWPRGFGVPHPLRLRGAVTGWREGAGWRVGTSALQATGNDVSVAARGGLWWQGDGTRPLIDVAADIGSAPVTAAKGFWIHYLMSKGAVDWLNTALIGGQVQNGRALVSGDLDDWPFARNNGLFHASARIRNARLKFQRDWPAAEIADAQVDFVADGMRVTGRGAIAGVPITQFESGIAHFSHHLLTVQAQGGDDAARMLALLRQSPLRARYGAALTGLSASGPASASFSLALPLGTGAASTISGAVELAGVRLADSRWNLAFDQVRGRARYDGNGFAAENLAVRHQGQAGRLSLRAGSHARDAANAFEADMQATVAAADLLARAPALDWLKPYVQGVSPWTVAVALPKSGGLPSKLQLRSNLVGTALRLPAPLDKPAAQPLAAAVDVQLPLGQGEIAVALGNRMALRARQSAGQTAIRIAMGASRVAEPPPASGLIASGAVERLDALDWVALTRGSSSGGRVPLRGVDLTVARLRMLGTEFANTRVRLTPVPNGTHVQFDGAALAGTLRVPQLDGAAIDGAFARMHWRTSGNASAAPAQASAATTQAAASVDPARIPPIGLTVDDFRLGDAALGTLRLRTQPVVGGMRIVGLHAALGTQRIDLSGAWTGRGTAARTQLEAHMASDDFGALLASLGAGGQLSDGKGSMRMDAAWAGSPGDFSLDAMRGTLSIAVRDGQLVQVEPGAGRVLGLLGVAQLPRRLTFDFSDLFDQGFAFDKAGGDIHFAGGVARSDNLSINGPAAEIHIRGQTMLRAQTFDQTIDVYPKTGNLLTVAGALAGGPVGAAIGAAANAVLRKPLGQLAAKTYRVTGPWKDPDVQVVNGVRPAPAKTGRPALEPPRN